MQFETLLGTREAAPFGLTFYDGAAAGAGVLTGNTLTRRFDPFEDRMGQEFCRLGNRIAVCTVQEAQNLEPGQHGARIDELVVPMGAVQEAVGVDLVHSWPVLSPQKFAGIFRDNPERLLSSVTPLKSAEFEERLFNDPTYAPVIFDKWGVKFVGWIKSGLLEVSFDTQYQPLVAAIVTGGAPVTPSPRSVPAAAPPMTAPVANLVQPPASAGGSWPDPRIKSTRYWQVFLPPVDGTDLVEPVEADRNWFGFTLSRPGMTPTSPFRVDFTRNQHFGVMFTVTVGGRKLSKGIEHHLVREFQTPVGTFNGDLQVGTLTVQRRGQDGTANYSITKIVDRHGSGPALGLLGVVIRNDDVARRGGGGVLSVWKPV